MEDIKARLEDKTNYPYEKGFNPYQLWMDAKALLNEMEYWKDRALEAEKPNEAHQHKYVLLDMHIAECECGHALNKQ